MVLCIAICSVVKQRHWQIDRPLIDTRYSVETPEGIELQADLAGPVPRVLAYSIDVLIRQGITLLLFLLLVFLGEAGWGFWMLLSFLLEWFYPVIFEIYAAGQTPGKKIMGIQVVNDDLTPVSLSTSVVRNLLRFADFLPFAYLAGLFSMSCTRTFQRLGDIAAGTLVIYKRQQAQPALLPDVAALAPSRALSLDEQVAIISFTERHSDLSRERQQELANILCESFGRPAERIIACLQGVGVWLLGGR
ncbi:MAG: RDD family protein [Pseudomonadales bacterium]|nr:RDD family protein [Pseudomonadales bacterium]